MDIKCCKEFFYRVQQGETINDINKKFNTCKQNIIRNNPEIEIYAGEWIKIKQNDYITHVVKPAETLEKIAKDYNMDLEKIIKDNALTNTRLFIGQLLKIYK